MMTVKTYLKEVEGKGLGLFSTENIKKGDVVYEDDKLLSKIIPDSVVESLGAIQKEFIHKYASYMKENDSWYLCLDDARFFNHSDTPNTFYDTGTYWEGGKGGCVATEDIPSETEITSDYRQFCDHSNDGDFGFEIK